MDNKIMVNRDGVEVEVEVLDIFQVNGYPNKEYILYTENEEIDNDNIEVFVSILEEKDDTFNFLNISDEVEWNAVLAAVNEMGDNYE